MTDRKTPEALGLSSAGMAAMLDAWREAGLAMHSVLVVRHGEIAAEGYAPPFDKDSFHRMYSCSKSFVSAAVGALAGEGKIALSDTIDRYFPDYVTAGTDPRVAKTRIVDLLRMASPFRRGSTYRGDRDTDWVATFFRTPADKDPGSEFCYDTSATYILDVIVERVTGMNFLEYLKEKALRRIGFSEDAWCVRAPEGYAWGGSGVMCTTRDLARFAGLLMHGGVYRGEQLLPCDYVAAATSRQIGLPVQEQNPEYGFGYGYQIWMTAHGFALVGMGDQFAICVPERDLLMVCTADNQGRAEISRPLIFRQFEEQILNRASDVPLPADAAGEEKLREALHAMEIPYQSGATDSVLSARVNGVTYYARDDKAPFSSFRWDFSKDTGTFSYDTPRGHKQIVFGIGKNVAGTLDEPQYSGHSILHPIGRGYRCLSSAAWVTPEKLALRVQVIDWYFGNMTLTFSFEENAAVMAGRKTAEWFLNEYVADGARFDARHEGDKRK